MKPKCFFRGVIIKWKPASKKETSPLAHFVRNSLPHKSFRFCSPMQKHMESANGNQTTIQPYRPFQDKLPIVAKATLPTCGSFCRRKSYKHSSLWLLKRKHIFKTIISFFRDDLQANHLKKKRWTNI